MIKKIRVVLIATASILVILQILLFLPSKTEVNENETQVIYPSIQVQLEAQKKQDEIKYTLKGVQYSVVEKGLKQWMVLADQTVVYEKSNLVVSDNVQMTMFDPQEKETHIDGDHAYFIMGSKSIAVEGKIKVLFPDNFWLRTERAQYTATDQRISSVDSFYGESKQEDGEIIKIWGNGFLGNKSTPELNILDNARVQSIEHTTKEITDVRSDRATINREKKYGDFLMASTDRFVESNKGTLFVKSKNQHISYDSKQKQVQAMIANQDVTIQETDPEKGQNGMKYSTSQKAEFFTNPNKIILSGYPSVYQKNDTVTGEMITVFRDKNLVEVTDANAYHEGENGN